jgi:hypothetical protein
VNAHGVNETPVPTADPNGGVATATVRLKNYSYGVSAWFYIHPQPPNTNSNYDSDNNHINMLQIGSFGPSIKYNPKNNTMQFMLYGIPIDLVVNDITLQTWNNVVINSDKGAVDIFINHKLIYTGHHVPKTNDPVPNAVNNVTVGQADGVRGEMCNVVLNTAPFTKPEISWLYKTNKASPPVIWQPKRSTRTPQPLRRCRRSAHMERACTAYSARSLVRFLGGCSIMNHMRNQRRDW